MCNILCSHVQIKNKRIRVYKNDCTCVYMLVHVLLCVTWCKTVVEEHDYVHEQWAVEGV
jgi:hypothetical protein